MLQEFFSQVLTDIQRFEMQCIGNEHPTLLAISIRNHPHQSFIIRDGRRNLRSIHITRRQRVDQRFVLIDR